MNRRNFRTGASRVKATNRADRDNLTPYGRLTLQKLGNLQQQPRGLYAASLLDPWNHKNVKIPDLSCYPTTTFTATTEFLWKPVYDSTGATSTTALYFDITATGAQWQYAKGYESNSNGGNRTGAVSKLISTAGRALYRASRPVSAGIRIRFAGNDTNSEGQISMVAEPGFYGGTSDGNAASTWFNAIMNPQQTKSYYIGPQKEGASAIYKPLDSQAFAMYLTDLGTTYGTFIVGLSGNETPGPFTVELIVNYEGTLLDTTTGLEVESTAMDVEAFQNGLIAASAAEQCTDGLVSTMNRQTQHANLVAQGKHPASKRVATPDPGLYATPLFKKSKY